MANPQSKEQKDFRNSWGVNPLKQRDETLVVLDGWHDWTRSRRSRHATLPIAAVAGLAIAACVVGASLAWM